jgi:peptide/nickel transport system substrate-binding protein
MISDFQSGKSIKLIRNPEWDASTDSRPAYLDTIEWANNVTGPVSGRQIFSGSGLASGDPPTPGTVRRFARGAKDRIAFTPFANRWVSLNYIKKPFSDLNVRKAVAAAMDRRAMQLTRGGELAGTVATHFLPPTIAGFEEAGGEEGAGVDYLAKPAGDPALAAEYMKKAGFASGKYEGPPIRMVSSSDSPGKETASVVRRALESLGFKVQQRSVDAGVFYSKFCNVESELKKIDVCMNYGWLPDFNDPYAMLYANFSGDAIVSVNNSNPSLFNDKAINQEMNEAAQIADPKERAMKWGEIDKELVRKVAAVPWFWDKQPNVLSRDVAGVIAKWNATWDLSYMSRK